MAYKLLGYLVWNGGRWYLSHKAPSRRTMALGFVALAVTGLAVAGAKRQSP
jgi:hypothetical protein